MFSAIVCSTEWPAVSHGALEAKLHVLGTCGQHVDVIIRVVTDAMTIGGELLQPVEILLLADAADREQMHDAAGRLHVAGTLRRCRLSSLR